MTTLILQSLRLIFVFTVLLGLLYPLAVTGLAHVTFRDQANGSLIERNGKTIGSSLIVQPFTDAKYFWPRPSAGSYATVPSGASNLGPTSAALQSNVVANAKSFRDAHKLADDARVPSDMIFTSASGLDPHISPEAARMQIARVATARGLGADALNTLVEKFVEPPQLGFLGESRVNVLLLNLALDTNK
jgi:K+-transporting ATPase ATPase C chain